MYNDPFNHCEIVQPKSWDFIMDAAGEDIKSNPRLIFTQKHKDWRDIMEWLSPNSISRRFESLPYEVQYDIYVNDREAFEDLPDETKERFKAARPQYYPDGGPINPPNGKTSIAERNPKQFDFRPEPSRFDEGVKASNNTAEVANYDNYFFTDLLPRPIQMPYDPPKRRKMSYFDADKIKDYNSTNYKYVPLFGKKLFEMFGGDGNYPYISSARNAINNYLIEK